MKKLLFCFMILLVTGCGKIKDDDVIKRFEKDVTKSDAYEVKGTMDIFSDEDTFSYNINVIYKEDDFYKVSLINKSNNHEQIILRNEEGVYVVTPSLNKSFKFQSEWPYNSSQAYIPKSILTDLKNDKNRVFKKTKDSYTITAKVDYPNNDSLTYEKVIFDKKYNLKKVTVYDNNDIEKIVVNFNNINYKKKVSKDIFELSSNVDENCCEETTGKMDSIIYPLYTPSETYLKTKETIDTDDGKRTILTFSGEKSFVLVEEPVSITEEHELIPVYGDPLLLNDSVAALSANSITWRNNNIEYYITSNNLTENEMLLIASSLNSNASLTVGK